MRTLLAAGAVLTLAGCATWSSTDRALLGAVAVCNAVDYRQSVVALSKPGYREANPLLGSHPSDGKVAAFKVAGVTGFGLLAHAMPEDRTTMLVVALVPCLAVVAHNQAIGARLEF